MILNGIRKLQKLKQDSSAQVSKGKSVQQKDYLKRGLNINKNLVYDKWAIEITSKRMGCLTNSVRTND